MYQIPSPITPNYVHNRRRNYFAIAATIFFAICLIAMTYGAFFSHDENIEVTILVAGLFFYMSVLAVIGFLLTPKAVVNK